MNSYYIITSISFDDSKYAYCEPTPDSEYLSPAPKCPLCGEPIGSLLWQEPRKVILSKPVYGDFVKGVEFLVSANFMSEYEKSSLTGIKCFLSVVVEKVRYMRNTSKPPPIYYSLDLCYSYARVDFEKSIFKGQKLAEYCELCSPFGCTLDEINGIHIDDTHWNGEDIFHLHEMGGMIFASQRFIDFCENNSFTNLTYVDTKDVVFGGGLG